MGKRKMLEYRVDGPDADGIYTLTYETPGAPHVRTVAGASKSKSLAEDECARLNELQIIDRRAVIRDRADRIADDMSQEGKKP
jgi:hypothetical protein